jgi:HEAT repeat protein
MQIKELFAEALKGEYDDEAPWHAVHALRRIGSREVLEAASDWCRSDEPLKRARGADVLAQLGCTADHPENNFLEESFSAVVAMAENEKHIQPLASAIQALGHIGDPRAIPLLVRYSTHPEAEIRFADACACGSFANEPPIVVVLVELMRDSDEDVRDWATFSLGSLGTTDTPEIRDAFADLLNDSSSDVVDEALAALAQRRDPRALPLILERLSQPDVDELTLESAGAMLGLRDRNQKMAPEDYISALQLRFLS